MDCTILFISNSVHFNVVKVINPGGSQTYQTVGDRTVWDGTNYFIQVSMPIGDTSTFWISAPNIGAGNYGLSSLIIDETTISDNIISGTRLTFSNLQSDHTINVAINPIARLNPFDCASGVSIPNDLNTTGWLEGLGEVDGTTKAGVRANFSVDGNGKGKYYCEFMMMADQTPGNMSIGIVTEDWDLTTMVGDTTNTYGYQALGKIGHDGTYITSNILDVTNNRFVLMAVDFVAGKIQFGRDNTQFNGGNPATGVNPSYEGISTSTNWYIGVFTTEWDYVDSRFQPTRQSLAPPVGFSFVPGVPIQSQQVNPTHPHGSISPSGSAKAIVNDQSITYTATPSLYYVVLEWTIDGTSIDSTELSYTLSDITSNHVINAVFGGEQSCTVTTEIAAGSGQILPVGPVTSRSGRNEIFNIVPNAGYLIDHLVIDGTTVEADSTYTVTDFSNDHTVVAHFKISTLETFDTFPAKSIIQNKTYTDNTRGFVKLIDKDGYNIHYDITYMDV